MKPFSLILFVFAAVLMVSVVCAAPVVDYSGVFSRVGNIDSYGYTGSNPLSSCVLTGSIGLYVQNIETIDSPKSLVFDVNKIYFYGGATGFFDEHPYGQSSCTFTIDGAEVGDGEVIYNYNTATGGVQITYYFYEWHPGTYTGAKTIYVSWSADTMNDLMWCGTNAGVAWQGLGTGTNKIWLRSTGGTPYVVATTSAIYNEQQIFYNEYTGWSDSQFGTYAVEIDKDYQLGLYRSRVIVRNTAGTILHDEGAVSGNHYYQNFQVSSLPLNVTVTDTYGVLYTKLMWPGGQNNTTPNYSNALDFTLNRSSVPVGGQINLTATVSGYSGSGSVVFYRNAFLTQTFTELYSTSTLTGVIRYTYTQSSGQNQDLDRMRAVLYDGSGNMLDYQDIVYEVTEPSHPTTYLYITPYDASHTTTAINDYSINVTDMSTGVSSLGTNISGTYTYAAGQNRTINIQISASGFASANTNVITHNFETSRYVSVFMIPITYPIIGYHSVSYTVIDDTTGAALSGVKCDILPLDANITTPVYSDINGLISTRLIDGGDMFYYFTKEGYNGKSDYVSSSSDIVRTIRLVSNAAVPGENFASIKYEVRNSDTGALAIGSAFKIQTKNSTTSEVLRTDYPSIQNATRTIIMPPGIYYASIGYQASEYSAGTGATYTAIAGQSMTVTLYVTPIISPTFTPVTTPVWSGTGGKPGNLKETFLNWIMEFFGVGYGEALLIAGLICCLSCGLGVVVVGGAFIGFWGFPIGVAIGLVFSIALGLINPWILFAIIVIIVAVFFLSRGIGGG